FTFVDRPFLFLNDDAWRDHDHQTLRLAAVADVAEQTVDIRDLAQDRWTELVAGLGERLEAAQQHRAAVRHVHGRAYRERGEGRLLEEHLEDLFRRCARGADAGAE